MAQAQAESVPYGQRAPKPTWAEWKDVLKRVKTEMAEDNLSLVAAGAAFYALLGIFPALAALVALYGLFTDPATVGAQMDRAADVMPEEARSVIAAQLERVASAGGTALGIGAVVSFLFTLWSSSKAVKSLMQALDIVYGEKEKRGFIAFNATALLLTCVVLLFVVIALISVAVIPILIGLLNLPPLIEGLATWLRWPLLGVIAVGILAVLYRYAPSRTRPEWRWVLRGATAAAILWLIGSALFSLYVSNFGSYNETFGSFAAVIVLMMWFYLSAFFVLLGGELSAELQKREEAIPAARPTRRTRPGWRRRS